MITCNDCKYTIVATVFSISTIRGRGTVCYHVQADGHDYVIKDSWPNINWTASEPEFLEKAEKVEIVGVPRIRGSEDLKVDGVIDSTSIRRKSLGGKEPEYIDMRVH